MERKKDSLSISCLFKEKVFFTMGVAKNYNVLGVYMYYNNRFKKKVFTII